MKKNYFLILLLCFPTVLLSQTENSWDGSGISSNSKLRSLNIFINVIYDVHPNYADSVPNPTTWPTATVEGINTAVPDWIYDFMDTVFIPQNIQTGLTGVFAESSFDSLQIIGSYIVVNVKESRVLSKGEFNCTVIISAAIDVINEAGGLQTLNGRNAISDYDYLGNSTIYYAFAIFRNINSKFGGLNPGSGFGSFSCYPDDQLKIGSNYYSFSSRGSLISSSGASFLGPNSIATHEISHSLFGSNAFHTSGGNHRSHGGPMPFFTVQGGYGLMGGASSSLVSCNGYERWRMHWKHPDAPDYITARNVSDNDYLISDISKETGNISFVLRDFVTYGDVVRIKLPYKDSEHASNQYIWLENHQVGNNNKLDYLYHSNHDCRPMGTLGVYAYYQVGRDVLSGTSGQVWDTIERDNLKIIPAEGYYDFSIQSENYFHDCVGYGNQSHIHCRETANPFCGYQDQEVKLYPPNEKDTLSLFHGYDMWWKKIGDQIIKNLPFNGDEEDAFSSHSKINMGTNPSTCNTKTYYNYVYLRNLSERKNFTSQQHRNNLTTYLTGLSIEMIPISNNRFRVNIRWDDYDVTNDARWTGFICNKERVNLKAGKTVELVQNRTVAQPYRDPVTGLFAQPTVLTCDSGSVFTQQEGSTVYLLEGSKIVLKEGAQYEMENGILRVMENGVFECEEGASVIQQASLVTISDGGKMILKEGAFYEATEGSEIYVMNGGTLEVDANALLLIDYSSLIVEDGGKMYLCKHNHSK